MIRRIADEDPDEAKDKDKKGIVILGLFLKFPLKGVFLFSSQVIYLLIFFSVVDWTCSFYY